MCNFFAQPDALAVGKVSEDPHKAFAADQMRAEMDEILYDRDFDGTTFDGVDRTTRGGTTHTYSSGQQQRPAFNESWASLSSSQISPLQRSSSMFFVLSDDPGSPNAHFRPRSHRHDSQTRGFFPRFADRFIAAAPP